MNRFVIACVVAALSFQFAATVKAAEQSGKPNVLMICSDDLNDWTGFLKGHPQALTPHMDALAKRGRNFANAHCAVPVCSASRVSVIYRDNCRKCEDILRNVLIAVAADLGDSGHIRHSS